MIDIILQIITESASHTPADPNAKHLFGEVVCVFDPVDITESPSTSGRLGFAHITDTPVDEAFVTAFLADQNLDGNGNFITRALWRIDIALLTAGEISDLSNTNEVTLTWDRLKQVCKNVLTTNLLTDADAGLVSGYNPATDLVSAVGVYDPSIEESVAVSSLLVSQLDDLSGNGNHYVQGLVAYQPTYNAALIKINDKPSLRLFSGDYMSFDISTIKTFGTTGDNEVCYSGIVDHDDGLTALYMQVFFLELNAPTNNLVLYNRYFSFNGLGIPPIAFDSDQNAILHSLVVKKDNASIWINDTEVGNANHNIASEKLSTRIDMSQSTASSNSYQGNLGAFAWFIDSTEKADYDAHVSSDWSV